MRQDPWTIGPATAVELALFAFATVAVIVALRALRRRYQDRRDIEAAGLNGMLRVIVGAAITRAWYLLGTFGIIWGISFLAVITPAKTPLRFGGLLLVLAALALAAGFMIAFDLDQIRELRDARPFATSAKPPDPDAPPDGD